MIQSPQIQDDEQLARLVRSTLQAATQPENGRLKHLMPPPPSRRQRPPRSWHKQLATACAVLVLCLGLVGLYQSGARTAATPVAITATFTSEPTMTSTATSTAVAQQTATPAPPTPLAALPLPVIRNP
jgi:uncharacterized iron-regulated membrane protein